MIIGEFSLVPTVLEVEIYFNQKGFEFSDAKLFFEIYESHDWKGSKGSQVKNWRAKALEWMWQKQKESSYQRSKSKLDIV